jgi:hypothetical protein
MSCEFDPYHEWLGIPREEQPPDLYRILGIKRFESNHIVIENAAARQMAHLRLFQAGPRGIESQQLLNEVAQARNCLVDPRKRSAYNATLRQNEGPPQASRREPTAARPHNSDLGSEAAIPAPPFKRSPMPPSNYTRRATRRRTRKKNPVYETLKVIIGGTVGIAIAAAILHYNFQFDLSTLREEFEKAGTPKHFDEPGQAHVAKKSEQPASTGSEAGSQRGSQDATESQKSRARSPTVVPRVNQNRASASGIAVRRGRNSLDPEEDNDIERGQRTMRHLAKYAAIPDPEHSERDRVVLLPIVAKPEDDIQLALLVNHKTLPGTRQFRLQEISNQPDEFRWQVDFSGDDTALPRELAQLNLREDGLNFEWLDNAWTQPDAKYLANGVLRLQVNRDVHEVQLRQPVVLEPATMDLNRGIAAVRWELPESIDLDQCYIECLGLEKGLPNTAFLPVERLPGVQGELWVRLHGAPDETGVVLHVQIERGRQVTVTVASYYFTGEITPPPQLVNNRDARITTANRRRWAKAVEARVKQAYEVAARLQGIDASSLSRTAARQELEKRKSRAEQILQEAQIDVRRLLNIDKWSGAMYQPAQLHFRVYFEVEGRQVDVMYTQGAQAGDRTLPTHPAIKTVPQ